jgi:hypothetical protein
MMCGRELLSHVCKAQLLCQLQGHVFVSLCWERTPCSRLGVWESCCMHVPGLACGACAGIGSPMQCSHVACRVVPTTVRQHRASVV